MFESTQLNPAAARELGRRYKLGRRLGFGGMAEVYEVEHRDLGTQHALKVLRIASPSMQNRLLQEGRMQAGLRHPNVVVVSDVIRLPGDVPALIMDLIVGPPLDLALKNFRPTVDQIDALGRGILRGIGAAHAHGLIHRDVKPENVLLSVERGGLVPKIADFGLAKVFESDGLGTRTGMAMGTPRHMAPEQFRDAKAVDHRADLYSVGTLLYSLASGCHAFVENDFIAVYTKATKGEFIPLREQVPDLPERMYRAVEASIVAELGDRVQSAAELLDLWTDGTPDPVDVFSNALCERLVALSPMGRDPGISSSNTNLMESRQSSDTGVTELVEPLGGQAESQSDLETEAVDRRSVHTAITISEEPATLDLTVTQQPAPEMARPRQGLGGVGVVLLLVAGIILGALGLNMIQTHNLTPTPPVEPVPVVVTPAPDVPVLPITEAKPKPVLPATWIAIRAQTFRFGDSSAFVPTGLLVEEFNYAGRTHGGKNPGFPWVAASPEHDVTLRAGGMAPQTLTDDEWVALGGELPKKAGRLSGFSDEVIAQVLNAASVRDGLKPALSKTLEWNGGNGYRLPTEAEWEAAFADQPGGRLERVLEPEPIPVVPGRGRPDLVLRGRNKERVFRWGRDERALLRLARSLD